MSDFDTWKFFFRNILVDGGVFGVVQSFFTQCCAFIKDVVNPMNINLGQSHSFLDQNWYY